MSEHLLTASLAGTPSRSLRSALDRFFGHSAIAAGVTRKCCARSLLRRCGQRPCVPSRPASSLSCPCSISTRCYRCCGHECAKCAQSGPGRCRRAEPRADAASTAAPIRRCFTASPRLARPSSGLRVSDSSRTRSHAYRMTRSTLSNLAAVLWSKLRCYGCPSFIRLPRHDKHGTY